jgi:hypothetical protein
MQQRADLTFKHNRDAGRHGWLRLTPAYSVTLVHELLTALGPAQRLLEPFSGTGTSAVVAAGLGHHCDAFDINPFLIWLGETKARNYSAVERAEVASAGRAIAEEARHAGDADLWWPSISSIERWWTPGHLRTLAAIFAGIRRVDSSPVSDLLKIAFSRVMIDWSNAAFDHQSMSFKAPVDAGRSDEDRADMLTAFVGWADRIARDVATPLPGTARFVLSDSRALAGARGAYTALITSPPYPNRMSYVRELRPYMYWLGFLRDSKAAGNLDWQAIGGTWGAATSRVVTWMPRGSFDQRHPIHAVLARIGGRSRLLANYVHRYFEDMVEHFDALMPLLASGRRCSTSSAIPSSTTHSCLWSSCTQTS